MFNEEMEMEFINIINNNNLELFKNKISIYNISYYESAKFLLPIVIQHNKTQFLDYLINLNSFDYYNNNEYLNYDIDELKTINLQNYKNYDFYDEYFAENEHPLFIVIDEENKNMFDYLLSFNINLNVINMYGISLLQYIRFNKKISKANKQYFIIELLNCGATWAYSIEWNIYRKFKLYNEKYHLIKKYLTYSDNLVDKNKLAKQIRDIELDIKNIYIDNYLIENKNTFI